MAYGLSEITQNGVDYRINDPNIANEFSASTAYSSGTYVNYNGILYQFTTDHPAGTWNASHVSAVEVGDEIADLKSALNFISFGNLDIGTLISNAYIQSSNGAQATWNGTSATNYLPCFMADKLIVSITATNPYAENAFYTHDKTFISSFQTLAGTHEITVPNNAYYVRFSNVTANIETLSVKWKTDHRISSIETKLENVNRVAKNAGSLIVPYADHAPTFVLSGTTISFYCDNMIGLKHVDGAGDFVSLFVQMQSAISVPHDYWCVWDITNNQIQAVSDANLNAAENANYSILFYNSSGNVRGPFELYSTTNKNAELFSAINKLNWKGNLIVAPYGSTNVNVYNDGTNIVMSNGRYVIYSDSDVSWKMSDMSSDPDVVVPHDYFAVYNNTSNKVEVKTMSQLESMSDKYYVLFYNSSGKMCGPFEQYRSRIVFEKTKKQMVGIIPEYPGYYDQHVKNKIDIINTKLSAVSSGDAFVFITDIHYPSNRMYSPSIINDICRKTGITKVILNGDYINEETSKTDALLEINRVCSLYTYLNVDTYRVVGNHEYNNQGASDTEEHLAIELSSSELRWTFINPVKDKIVYDTDTISYYFDNEKDKIRYFVGQVSRGSGQVGPSIKWIADQVQRVPNDYAVVIFIHTALSASGGSVHLTNEHYGNIIDAMKHKTSYDYLGVTYDYTGKTFDFVGSFCGDYHLDMDYSTTHGGHIIATTCDAHVLQEGSSLIRTGGTYAEQAFDVVVIDRASRKIFLTRIGAGVDREFSF